MDNVSYIGVTNFSSKGKRNYHYVKSEHEKGGRAGGVNPYRIFPPFGALAADGRVYEYHAHHEVTNSKGEKRSFKCIEETDWQTKMIKVHCPFCDTHKRNQDQYKIYQTQNAPKEDLAAFNANHVQAYQNQGRYYLNAINLENEIGVLALTSKSFKAFKALHATYAKQGFDITGMRGMFINFTKLSQYKGDNQPVFNADLLKTVSLDPATGMPVEKMHAPHDLTPEIIARMKTECFELNNMYKNITAEQMQVLLGTSGPARGLIVDTLFALPERKPLEPENDPSKVNIGGDMYAVGRLQSTPTGPELIMPSLNNMGNTGLPNVPLTIPQMEAFVQPLQPNTGPTTLTPQPLTAAVPLAPTQPASPLPTPAVAASMSDDEFRKAFGNI